MLFLACWRKHKPMVKALLAAGAKVDTPDQRGWTPLMIAAYNDLRDIVTLLLTCKPNLDAKDCVTSSQFGKRAIDRAKSREVRHLLQEALVHSQYGQQPPLPIPPKDCDSLTQFFDSHQRKTRLHTSLDSSEALKPPITKSSTPSKPIKDRSVRSEFRPSSSESSLRDISPKRDDPSTKAKLREELNKHIQAAMTSLGAKLASENTKEMQMLLNSELKKAQEMMEMEVKNTLIRSGKEVFVRLKHNMEVLIEETMRDRGLPVISNAKNTDFEVNLSLSKGKRQQSEGSLEGYRVYEQLLAIPPTKDLTLPVSKPGTEDLKLELINHISRHSEDLEVRLAKVTRGCIVKEVSARVQKTKAALISQLRDWMGEVSLQIERRLEEWVETRVPELISATALQSPLADSTSPKPLPDDIRASQDSIPSDDPSKDAEATSKPPTKRAFSEKRPSKPRSSRVPL